MTPSGAFGIIGVSGGLVYADNSCVASEATYFNNVSLYANTGFNLDTTAGSYFEQAMAYGNCTTNSCGAYYYGYLAGVHAAKYAQSQGVSSPTWWLDVETGNTWNSDTSLNRQALQGEYDGINATAAPTTIGVYSTTSQWGSITGGWLNNWPVWYATAVHKKSQAIPYCKDTFTNGETILVQFRGRLDQDYAC